MFRRGIRTDEIEEALGAAEIIEEYPDDKYGPSLLLLGVKLPPAKPVA